MRIDRVCGVHTWNRCHDVEAATVERALRKGTRRGQPAELSARQSEIARLVALGKSNREIAAALFLTERTVETHISAIFNKLEVRSRTELAVAMLREPASAGANHNLPFVPKRLIGRDTEATAHAEALTEHRMVTVTGTGGIGKTRMALETGVKALGAYPDGVWFADLTTAHDEASTATAVSFGLALPESRVVPSLDTVATAIGKRRLLLILDNCEHVIAQTARLAEAILHRCPHARILATSREPLRIGGERALRLPSLPVEDAVALFIERAQASDPHFAADDATRAAIAAICDRLDGIPLAIEMAAARTVMMRVDEIARNLDHRFALLSRGERTALPRHQTMRALFDWSYDLLGPAEQRFLAYASVFSGGFRGEHAAQICAGWTRADRAIFELLSPLVEKSLIVAEPDGASTRYRLLESIRAYAREKLSASGEAEHAAREHARTFVELARAHEAAYGTMPEPLWRAQAERELENWRAALRWSLAEENDIELGQRLAGALAPVWRHFAYAEGRDWVRRALAHSDDATPDAIRASLSFAQASIALGYGDYAGASTSARAALTIFERLDERSASARTQHVLGWSLVWCGDAAEATERLERALSDARALGDLRLAGLALESLGVAHSVAGDSDAARSRLREALAVFADLAAERSATMVAINLAESEFKAGDAAAALDIAASALEAARKLNEHFVADVLANIAAYLVRLERYTEARMRAVEAYDLAREFDLELIALWALQRLTAIALLQRGRTEPAATLLGYIDAQFVRLGATRHDTEQHEYEQLSHLLADSLERGDRAALWSAGAALDGDAAIRLALAASDEH